MSSSFPHFSVVDIILRHGTGSQDLYCMIIKSSITSPTAKPGAHSFYYYVDSETVSIALCWHCKLFPALLSCFLLSYSSMILVLCSALVPELQMDLLAQRFSFADRGEEGQPQFLVRATSKSASFLSV